MDSWQGIWTHINFPVKVYILPSRQARENVHFDKEYESMYLVKNPYNEYVLLQSD
jgi:hypothetical protein